MYEIQSATALNTQHKIYKKKKGKNKRDTEHRNEYMPTFFFFFFFLFFFYRPNVQYMHALHTHSRNKCPNHDKCIGVRAVGCKYILFKNKIKIIHGRSSDERSDSHISKSTENAIVCVSHRFHGFIVTFWIRTKECANVRWIFMRWSFLHIAHDVGSVSLMDTLRHFKRRSVNFRFASFGFFPFFSICRLKQRK